MRTVELNEKAFWWCLYNRMKLILKNKKNNFNCSIIILTKLSIYTLKCVMDIRSFNIVLLNNIVLWDVHILL